MGYSYTPKPYAQHQTSKIDKPRAEQSAQQRACLGHMAQLPHSDFCISSFEAHEVTTATSKSTDNSRSRLTQAKVCVCGVFHSRYTMVKKLYSYNRKKHPHRISSSAHIVLLQSGKLRMEKNTCRSLVPPTLAGLMLIQ